MHYFPVGSFSTVIMKFNSIAFVAFLVASAQAAPKDRAGGLSSLGNRVIKFECKNGLMVMIFSFGREITAETHPLP